MSGLYLVLWALGALAIFAGSILTVVAWWILFKKAGRPGWFSLIPVCNQCILLRISGLPMWWVLLLCIPVVNLLFLPCVSKGVARSFGKTNALGWGLFLLPLVFYPVLAFGKAAYVGPLGEYASWAVFKRELKSYFTTPLAYVFLVIFLAVAGYLPFAQGWFRARQADLQAFFTNLPWLFVFLAPAVAMRLWAEERKIGSVELLFTLPVTIGQAVLAKFFAAWAFLGIALVLTFPIVVTAAYLGDPDGSLIATGYVASFLVAGGFLAVSCFFSALSKNQVIAFVLSLLACAVLLMIGMPSVLNYLTSRRLHFLPDAIVASREAAYYFLLLLAWLTTCELGALIGIPYLLWRLFWLFLVFMMGPDKAALILAKVMVALVNVMEGMSLQIHFDSMQKGILQFKDIAYFVILIAGWIAACTVVLDERKAS